MCKCTGVVAYILIIISYDSLHNNKQKSVFHSLQWRHDTTGSYLRKTFICDFLTKHITRLMKS